MNNSNSTAYQKYRSIRSILIILLLLLVGQFPSASTGTITPSPFQTVLDNNGAIAVNAKIYTYVAGTSTQAATWSDQAMTVSNGNPIIADGSGRFVAYLLPGASYKFVYQTSDGGAIKTVDNIAATPTTSAGVDIIGTAGEALSSGQAVYLSDGSGSKSPGQWYRADSANTYSSTLPVVGVVPAAISAAQQGTIRIAGSVTGLSSLSVGLDYYVGTAGALTLTPPANRRVVGRADSTSSLVLVGLTPATVVPVSTLLACGRLTLTTAVPMTTADVTAATTLYYTPVSGCNQFTVFNGTVNVTDTLTETSIAVPATTSTMYDVFAFDNNGAINIEALAWTNDTTRATALTLQNGFLAKAATPARRYVGSFRTTTVSGQTEDSVLKRYVWNYYNRVERQLERLETATSWTYNTNTIRVANGSTCPGANCNQLDLVIGVSEEPVMVDLTVTVVQITSTNNCAVGIGLDSTSTFAANQSVSTANLLANAASVLHAVYRGYPGIGRHFLSWNEDAGTATTTTFYGSAAAVNGITIAASAKSGLVGSYKG